MKTIKNKYVTALLFILAFITVFSYSVSALPEKRAKALTTEEILNSAELHPIKTGYKELDTQIEEIFASNFTSGMTTYDKVWCLYKYMVETFEYDNSYLIYINRDIYPILQKVPYKSTDDAYEVFRALRILRLKLGACTYYSSLYMIMLRAIGIEAYTVTGMTNTVSGGYTGHTWVSALIDGVWYNFDPQVEDNITNRTADKKVGSYRFCKTDSQLSGKIKGFNRSEDMAEFGGFQIEGIHAPLLNGLSDGNTVYVYSGGTVSILPDVSANGNGITYSVYMCGGYTEEAETIRESECIGTSLKSEEITMTISTPGEYSILVDATDGTNTSSSVFHLKAVNLYQCPPKTEVQSVTALLDDESSFITDKDGSLKNNGYIGTGDVINSEKHSVYFAYVSGDTDGDGTITSTDYMRIKSAFLGIFEFDALFAEAADYNHDSSVDSTDYLSIKTLMLSAKQ